MKNAEGNNFFLLHIGADKMVQQVQEFALRSDTVEFYAWNTYSGRRTLIPIICDLTSFYTWQHTCPIHKAIVYLPILVTVLGNQDDFKIQHLPSHP